MSGIEVEDIQIDQPNQLTDRQLSSLVSLWRLSHYKQAPLSTWSILYSRRRPRRSRGPILCFDTKTYEILRQQREDDFKKKQLHQHQIWQHVQDRLAEQNRILEQEKTGKAKTKAQGNEELQFPSVKTAIKINVSDLASPDLSPTSSYSSSPTITSGSCSPELNPTKRSIRWGLHNNMTKRFDKTSPITLVTVPATDKLPGKSALKVRTAHTIQKQPPKSTKTTATTTTTTTTTITTTSTANTAAPNNNHPPRKRAVDFF
ncbi:hypothetical protein BGX21_004558 [Mortierella sp. AD011]|nr:hypothetical protein BGX20_000073 [Mortierella sp. AD010]KAF9373124.1 hypothetical protein BGX21_004558 [Mortierella sp. AD011]